jgi:putative transposase
MRSRYEIREPHTAQFVTSTIVEWLPVFTSGACCDILVESLLYCQAQRALLIHAWVIMDNHFHAILAGPDLAATLGNLKKFTAKRLLEQLAIEQREWLLKDLHFYRAAHKTRSEHQVWQEGVHPKAIVSDEMMLQKLEYVHSNPVQRGWVAAPEHWRYSSAHEWCPGAIPMLRCDPWR